MAKVLGSNIGRLFALILVVSCSNDPKDTNSKPRAATDAGDGQPDAETPDSGPVDAGQSMMECNPIDGMGCTTGDYCFYIGDPIGVQCRMQADPPIEHGEECSRSLKNCRAGFYCVLFQGESGNARCRKVCDRGSHRDCASLTGNTDGYECTKTIDAKRNLGVCAPVVPECLPYDDMCDPGEYCEYMGGRVKCVEEGTGRRGGSCDIRYRCQRGSICMTVNSAAKCYEPCNPASAACSNASHQCQQQTSAQGTDLPFGICVP